MIKANLVAAVAILCACTTTTPAPSSARAAAQGSPDYITSLEVAATPVANVYDLINRLRPQWLRTQPGSIRDNTRSQIIAVYLDDARIGDIASLRSISTSGVQSLRYYDAVRAGTLLHNPGSDPIAGAIVISTSNQ